jgi:hypothetical protein
VQRQARDDEIEGGLGEGGRLLVGLQAGAVALRQQARGDLDIGDPVDPGHAAQPPADEPVIGAEARRPGKAPVDGAETLHEVVGHAPQEEIVAGGARRHPVAALRQKPPVEDLVNGHGVAFLSGLE